MRDHVKNTSEHAKESLAVIRLARYATRRRLERVFLIEGSIWVVSRKLSLSSHTLGRKAFMFFCTCPLRINNISKP